jgi:hypothetical protein
MKSTALLLSAALASTMAAAPASAQEAEPKKPTKPDNRVALDEVPAAVAMALFRNYADIELREIKREQKKNGGYHYEFKFERGADGFKGDVVFDADGVFISADEFIPPRALPEAVLEAWLAETNGAVPDRIERRTRAGEPTTFQIKSNELKGAPLRFDQAGKVVLSGKAAKEAAAAADPFFAPGGPGGKAFTGRGFLEAEWSRWGERVAKAARMDEEQTRKATEMLDLARAAAAEYRRLREPEIKRIAADLAELRKAEKPDAVRIAGLEKAASDLVRPLEEIGRKWQNDVLGLLNAEQRKSAEGVKGK